MIREGVVNMEQEQLRHQYLEALGVSSWLPCAVLPGAAESAAWVSDFRYPAPEIPFESDRAASARSALAASGPSVSPLSKSAPTTPAARATAQQSMSQARAALGLGAEPASTPKVEPAPLSPVAEPSSLSPPLSAESVDDAVAEPSVEANLEPPRFKLAFLRVGELLVVDSVPPQGGHFGDNYQALAKAIASALGIEGEQGPAFMLPWPMFASKTLDQGYKQASIAVQHKLSKELQAYPIKAVLLFGEAAVQMAMERQEPLEQLKGICFELRSGVKAIASHSLTEAMQLPGIKKQIWTDMQPLLTALS
ncbi:MAG: hypothetical protein AXW15_11685 [Neptuniibacter sp. Phe_28]|jgi:hypothetical protein|nr:MAG: hypothetical protein AXW15_11685 [Neptuniibacter sp. Phe_28]|tara:strand:+ start:2274 stop:3197 length:924 start_codon:yes stop_codon:yes gene_type:complete